MNLTRTLHRRVYFHILQNFIKSLNPFSCFLLSVPIASRVHRYTGIGLLFKRCGGKSWVSVVCLISTCSEWKPYSGKTENSKGSLSQFIYIESTGQVSETEDLKLETWDDVQQTKKTLQLSFETLKDALVVIFNFILFLYVANLPFIYFF